MNKSILSSVLVVAFAASISGCNEQAKYDAEHQAGANPPLPDAKNFFTPPMQVPKHVGWQNGEAPKVAEGLKIEKIASGLEHPRQVYGLPNGDILVAESNSPDEEPVTTPKQLIAGPRKVVRARRRKARIASRCCESALMEAESGTSTSSSIICIRRSACNCRRHALRCRYRCDPEVSVQDGRRPAFRPPASSLPTCRIRSTITGRRRCWRAATARSCMSASARTAMSPRTVWKSNTGAQTC